MKPTTSLHPLRRRSAAVLAVGLLVAATVVLGGHVVSRKTEPPAHAVVSPAATTSLPEGQPSAGSARQPEASIDTVVAAQLNRIRHLPPVSTPSEAQPRITGDAMTQPDLFAAEFVRRLLTQDF
ncbi:hypothetical protein, partial [Lapillicoccus sp.]|uniref:hypothetical protein n=1 Tax=Lapillicoccus sp. TaxID=1909287 RepID=UPI0025EC446D